MGNAKTTDKSNHKLAMDAKRLDKTGSMLVTFHLSARATAEGTDMAKVKRTPEGLAAAIEAQGYKVERRNHGWLCFPDDPTKPAEWISRNTNGRGQRNNEAVAKRFGAL